MCPYEVIVRYSREDKAYIAEVPALPGCLADGRTKGEAMRNVDVVAAEWLETAKALGRAIPQPEGYEESSGRKGSTYDRTDFSLRSDDGAN